MLFFLRPACAPPNAGEILAFGVYCTFMSGVYLRQYRLLKGFQIPAPFLRILRQA